MYESMIFYKSFYDAIQGLDAELQAEIYNAVFKYGLYGEIDELSPIANTVFTLIKPQIDANNKRKENGKKGAEYGKLGGRPKKDNPEETPKEPQKNPTKTPNVNANANVNVNANVISNRRFTPPTLEEVQAYCNERGNKVDPARFIDFYESKGWMVGKNKMKDWKACIRTWEMRNKQETKPNAFTEYQQNQYDYDELERRLTANVKSG